MSKEGMKAVRNINYAIVGLMIVGAIEVLLGGFTFFLPAIIKSVWGSARTAKDTVIFNYYLLIGIGLVLTGSINFFLLSNLMKFKKWAAIIAILSCTISAVFFLMPIQPLNDLPTSLISIGTIMFLCAGWEALEEDVKW